MSIDTKIAATASPLFLRSTHWGRVTWGALGALFLLVSLPFLGSDHRLPLPSVHQEFLAIWLGLAWLLASLLASAMARAPWHIPALIGWPAVAVIAIALQVTFLPVVRTETAVLGIIYLIWFILVTKAAYQTIQLWGQETVGVVMAAGISMGAIALGITGLLNQWLPDDYTSSLLFRGATCRICGNLPQANLFADYLWLGIASLLVLGISSHVRWRICWPLIILLLTLSVLSKSRSTYLFCVWVMTWLSAWRYSSRHTSAGQRPKRPALGLPVALLLSIVAIQSVTHLSEIPTGAERIVSTGARMDSIRQAELKAAWSIFSEHPWLGAGFGTYRDLYPSQHVPQGIRLDDDGSPKKPEHSHNLLAEIAVDFGLAGLTTFALWWILWLRQIKLRSGSPATWLGLGLLGILSIHSMLEYPLWYAHFLGIAAIAMALGLSPGHSTQVGSTTRSFLTALATALVFMVGLLYVMYARYAAGTPSGI